MDDLIMRLDAELAALIAPLNIDPVVLTMIGIWLAVFSAIILIVYWVSMWLIFEKAGKPGWLTIIPIVNLIIFLQVADKSLLWLVLLLIPGLNIIVMIYVWWGLGRAFGHSNLFNLGLIFFNFIFVVILAFNESLHEPGKVEPSMVYATPMRR